MKKPTLQFQRLNAAQLLQYAEQILGKMQQHPDLFETPTPPLADLEAAIGAFRDATTEAAFRDRRAIVLREQRQTALKALIYELSKYVDSVAGGDEAVVLAAGFVPSKPSTNRNGRAPQPGNLRAVNDFVGSARIQLRVDRWPGARLYQFEHRKKGSDQPWQHVLSSKSTCVLENLDIFEEYEFRVAYRGVDPMLVYSDVVSSYVV